MASVEYSVYVDQSVIKQGYYIILTLTLHSDNTFIVSPVMRARFLDFCRGFVGDFIHVGDLCSGVFGTCFGG